MSDHELCEDCLELAEVIEPFVDRDVVMKLFKNLPNYSSTWDKDTASAIDYVATRVGLSGFDEDVVIDICNKLGAYLLYKSLKVLDLEKEEDAELIGPPIQGHA